MTSALAFAEEDNRLAAPREVTTAQPSVLATTVSAVVPEQLPLIPDPAAIFSARRLAERFPSSATAHSRLAQAALAAGEKNAALNAARSALRFAQEENDREAAVVAVQVLTFIGSEEDHALARSASPDLLPDPFFAAAIAALLKDYSSAVKLLTAVDSGPGLALRGWLQLMQGNYSWAIRDLRRSTRELGPTAETLNNLAYAYGALGLHRKAIRTAHEALYFAPYDKRLAINLLTLLLASRDTSSAVTEMERVKRLFPDDVQVAAALAEARLRAGDEEGALKELRAVAAGRSIETMDPSDRAELVANIAFMEWRLGRSSRDDTIAILRRELLRSGFASLGIGRLLASLFNRSSDLAQLEALYQGLLEWHEKPDLLELEARLLYLREDFDSALTVVLEWLKNEPFNPDPAITATYLLSEYRQDWKRAAQLGAEVLRRVPSSNMLANNVAYAWVMAGHPDLAKAPATLAGQGAYATATRALIDLAEEDFQAGVQGYESAARMAEENDDPELAVLIRTRAVIAFANAGLLELASEDLDHADPGSDPRYRLLRLIAGL